MDDTRRERIRQRAHEIWERDGHPHGRDAEHWSRAEAEIDAEEASGNAAPAEAVVTDADAPDGRAATPATPRKRKAAPAKSAAAVAPDKPAKPAKRVTADAETPPAPKGRGKARSP